MNERMKRNNETIDMNETNERTKGRNGTRGVLDFGMYACLLACCVEFFFRIFEMVHLVLRENAFKHENFRREEEKENTCQLRST